jgi:ribonuclease HI
MRQLISPAAQQRTRFQTLTLSNRSRLRDAFAKATLFLKPIYLCHVPSHQAIPLNEEADKLTEAAQQEESMIQEHR